MPSTMDENGNVVDLSSNNVANTNNGKINAQGIASALGGAASAFGTAYSTIADIQSPEQIVPTINSFRLNPNAGGNSLDSWTQSYLNTPNLNSLSLKDVGWNSTKGAFNILGSTVQGATAGKGFGLPGIIGGGVLGLSTGLYGFVKGKQKANETRYLANEAVKDVNKYNQDLLANNLANIKKNQFNNLLRNYSAFGGPLNMSGDGVLSPFGSRFSIGGPMHSYGADWTNGIKIIGEGGTHEENPYEGVQMGIDPQGVPNLVEEGEIIWNDYVFSNRMKVPKKDRVKYKLTGPKNLTYAEAAKKAQKESEERPNDPISKRGLEEAMARLADSQEEQRQKEFMGEIEEQAKELGMTPEELLYAMQQQQQQPMVAAYGGSIHIKPSKKGTFTTAAKKHGKSVQEFASQVLANKDNYSSAMVKKANFAKNAAGWKHGLGGNLFATRGQMEQMYTGLGAPYNYFGWFPPIVEESDDEFTTIPNNNTVKQYPNYLADYLNGNVKMDYTSNKVVPTSNIEVMTDKGWVDPLRRNILQQENLSQHFAIPESTQKQVQANVKNRTTKNNLGSGVVNGPDYDWFTGLRYAPILSSAISGIRNLLTPADYSRANDVERAYSNINDVKVTPKYNYMQYRPIDRMIMANMIGQQAAATRRNIMNTSGGNRGTAIAGLLASDNQYLNKLGEAFIAGDAENYKRYAQTLDTNNKINQWLGQLDLGVQEANQRAAEARARGVQLSRGMMDTIDAQRAAAISNDWTNVAQGLGDIGWEQFNRNMVNTSNPLYSIDSSGNVFYDPQKMIKALGDSDSRRWMVLKTKNDAGETTKAEEEELAELYRKANTAVGGAYYGNVPVRRGKRAKGGYLTIKGRRK